MAACSDGRVAGVREAHVDDVGAVVDGPDDALDDVAVLAEAVRVEDGDRHDLDAGVADAGDALRRCRSAAAMMPAMAVPWPFGSVVPAEPSRMLVPGNELTGEVGMGGIDAGVEEGDDRADPTA